MPVVAFDAITPTLPPLSENLRAPTIAANSLIDPASYGFDSVEVFDDTHASTALLDGTWFRQDVIAAEIASASSDPSSRRIDGSALLALERTAGDYPTIACIFHGRIIGHLGEQDALRIADSLLALVAHRRHLQIPVSLRVSSMDSGKVEVYVRLPSAHGVMPANGYPREPWLLLPGGQTLEIPVHKDHAAQLIHSSRSEPLERGELSRESRLAVTVHCEVRIRARSAQESLAVYVDGVRLGSIPTSRATPSLPLIKVLDGRGLSAVMRGSLLGDSQAMTLRVEAPNHESLDPHLVSRVLSLMP